MEDTTVTLTVFFDEPFYVGVVEKTCGKKLAVCKITFGAEPKDYDVYHMLLERWKSLSFSPSVHFEGRQHKKTNAKRMQRQASRQVSAHGVGTKSQQALQLQHKQGKQLRKETHQRRSEQEKEERFALKQQKKKEKKKGH